MQIHVGEVSTSIHSVDTEELLSPRLLERIVEQVLKAVDERQGHRERIRRERCTADGSEDWESGGRR